MAPATRPAQTKHSERVFSSRRGGTEITPIASGVGLRIEAPESERFGPVARSSPLCPRALFYYCWQCTTSLLPTLSSSYAQLQSFLFSSTLFFLFPLSLSLSESVSLSAVGPRHRRRHPDDKSYAKA